MGAAIRGGLAVLPGYDSIAVVRDVHQASGLFEIRLLEAIHKMPGAAALGGAEQKHFPNRQRLFGMAIGFKNMVEAAAVRGILLVQRVHGDFDRNPFQALVKFREIEF